MLSQGVIQLPKTKTGPGTVILNADAQRLLQTQLDSHTSEWVFPKPKNGQPYSGVWVGQVWHRASLAAGLMDFTFHDLRHHGATVALNAGVNTPIVMTLGRWTKEKTMRRYAAVTDRSLRVAAEVVAGKTKEEAEQSVRAMTQEKAARRLQEQNQPSNGSKDWQQSPNYVTI